MSLRLVLYPESRYPLGAVALLRRQFDPDPREIEFVYTPKVALKSIASLELQ